MQNTHIVMQRETGLYNIIKNGKVVGVGLSGDLLGRAPEMYEVLREILKGLDGDDIKLSSSLLEVVKCGEGIVAEIGRRCTPEETDSG